MWPCASLNLVCRRQRRSLRSGGARGDGARAHALNAAILMALIAVIAPLGWGHTYMMVLPLVMLQLIAMRDARPIVAIAIFCLRRGLDGSGRSSVCRSWKRSPDWLLNLIYSRYLLATLVLAAIPSASIGRTTESPIVASA